MSSSSRHLGRQQRLSLVAGAPLRRALPGSCVHPANWSSMRGRPGWVKRLREQLAEWVEAPRLPPVARSI